MTQPTPQQVAAAIGTLRADATMWQEMAGTMREAAGTADRLDLTKLHFSKLGDMIGIVALYRDIQDRMAQLMREGGANFDVIATALQTAAAGYEKDEQDTVHRMRNIY
jgi:hypothetical protein